MAARSLIIAVIWISFILFHSVINKCRLIFKELLVPTAKFAVVCMQR